MSSIDSECVSVIKMICNGCVICGLYPCPNTMNGEASLNKFTAKSNGIVTIYSLKLDGYNQILIQLTIAPHFTENNM